MQTSCLYLAITGYFKALNLDRLIEIIWVQHLRLSTGHTPPNFKTGNLILNITSTSLLSFEKKMPLLLNDLFILSKARQHSRLHR